MRPIHAVLIAAALVFGTGATSCSSSPPPPDLAADCTDATAALRTWIIDVPRALQAERTAVDTEAVATKGYCSGDLPADPTLASAAVRASSAHIRAIDAIVKGRP